MIGIDDVKQLMTQADEQTLTLYLAVDNSIPENQADEPAWSIWLKNNVRELGEQYRNDKNARWAEIQEQLEDYLETYKPSSKGLVLFVTPDNVRAYELPLTFENSIAFGQPQITQLLWAIDEYEPYLVALVDQEKARLFVSYLGDVGFRESLEIDVEEYDFRERTTMHAPGPGLDNAAVHGGTGRDNFEKMLDEHRHRFYRDVAAQIEKAIAKYKAHRIVIGGAEQSAHAVAGELPEQAREKIVTIKNIPLRDTTEQIFNHLLPDAEAFERNEEVALVGAVVDFAKAGGRGALGYDKVKEALEMQRVETLIVSWPAADEEQATELILRAFELNSNVELVHGAAADLLHQEGGDGYGARLYYAL